MKSEKKTMSKIESHQEHIERTNSTYYVCLSVRLAYIVALYFVKSRNLKNLGSDDSIRMTIPLWEKAFLLSPIGIGIGLLWYYFMEVSSPFELKMSTDRLPYWHNLRPWYGLMYIAAGLANYYVVFDSKDQFFMNFMAGPGIILAQTLVGISTRYFYFK